MSTLKHGDGKHGDGKHGDGEHGDGEHGDGASPNEGLPRREFFSDAAMAGSLVAGYGTLMVMAGRYLYLPTGSRDKTWLFVAAVKGLSTGSSLEFETPTGMKIVVARRAEGGSGDEFVALSSVCPHLGCRVYWQPQENRFFCPCHEGSFDPQGKATGGPPAAAGQSLAQYPLKVENGLLFIEVSLAGLSSPEKA